MERHDQTTPRQPRLALAGALALSIAVCIALGLFVTLAPGRAGAIGFGACALCALAGLVALCFKHDESTASAGRADADASGPDGSDGRGASSANRGASDSASGRTDRSPAPLPSLADSFRCGGERARKRAVGTALCVLAASFAFSVGFGILLLPALSNEQALVAAIAGFIMAAAAIVCWWKSLAKHFAKWNSIRAGEETDASAPPQGRRLPRWQDIACAGALAVGAGLCTSLEYTPLVDTAAWGIGCTVACLACLGACCGALFHVPKMARQLGDMHDLLTDTIQEKDEYRERVGTVRAEMADLRVRHKDALKTNKKLNQKIDLMREERQNAAEEGDLSAACAAIIEEYKLTRRESDVFVQLARGRSRKRIAEELVVELSTVSSHVVRIYRKLDVHSNQELIDFVRSYQ